MKYYLHKDLAFNMIWMQAIVAGQKKGTLEHFYLAYF